MHSKPKSRSANRRTARHEFERLAPRYDARWPSYIARTTSETLKRVSLDSGHRMRLLDVGCGTGVLLKAVTRRFPGTQAIGIDPAPAMLRIARRRLPDGVALVEGRAEHLPFPDGQFDIVVSCSAFHYWEDPHRALQETRRVLKPGGQLVITDWCHDFLLCKLCVLFLRATRHSFERIYGTGQCTRLLADAGFQASTVDRYMVHWYWGLMTARAKK